MPLFTYEVDSNDEAAGGLILLVFRDFFWKF